MYKVYFRQAIQMLKQNKFISIISILGTALAIMMIMTIIVVEKVQNINITPENKRDRTLYIDLEGESHDRSSYHGPVHKDRVRDFLYKMETPELVTAYTPLYLSVTRPPIISRGDRTIGVGMRLRQTDDNFWKVFKFDFVDGKPFSREEFDSGIAVAVISESVAKELFDRNESPVGQTIEVYFNPYRIAGVVKDVSPVFTKAQGDIWVPYTAMGGERLNVAIVGRSRSDFPAIIEEVRNIEKRYSIVNPDHHLTFGGPKNHKVDAMAVYGDSNEEIAQQVKVQNRKMFLIMAILLLVPAVNLSGFSLSRIKKRMPEIGIRKAFGARKYTILSQVLYENMITSLIGGVIGLVMSFLVVYYLRYWLLGVPTEHSMPVSTMISVPVFIAVFVVCLLINLLSAGLPAYRASRATIVDSLTQNEKKS